MSKLSPVKPSLEGEKKLLLIYLVIMAVLSTMTMGYFFAELMIGRVLRLYLLLVMVFVFLLALYYYICFYYFEDLRDNRKLPVIHTLLEITALSVVIYLVKLSFSAAVVLTGPIFMVYPLFIMLTALRGSAPLSLLSMGTAIFQFSLLFWLFLPEVPPLLRAQLVDLGWLGYIQTTIYLAFGGLGSFILAKELSKKSILPIDHP